MPTFMHALRTEIATPKPGLLLQPFGWAACSVMHMARAEPRLLAHLTDLDRLRLHAIALYLAYRDDETPALEDAAFLSSARSRDIVEKAVGRPPRQLLGLLRRLPDCALERELYKRLVAIAADEEVTKLLMGYNAISANTISRLASVPPVLCRAALLYAVRCDILKFASIAEVCDWLQRRWKIEAASQYLKASSLAQVRQVTLDLMRGLPPVPLFPPRTVSAARIIETAEDFRRAGRAAKNCLAHSTHELNLNHAAFYIWQDADESIYIRLNRPYGLGWFLSEMKLGQNRTPSDDRLELVTRAFAEVGIDRESVGDALTLLLFDSDDDDVDELED